MPTLGNYYIDAPNLASASTVYTDAAMTTPAGNGYYSDGSVVRQQVGGLLQASEPCPDCTQTCDTAIGNNGVQGIYEMNFNLGSNPGCVIIYFNPGFRPDGIRTFYDSSYFNRLTSPLYGFLGSPNTGNYSFIGRTLQDCGIASQLDSGGYAGLVQYEWAGSSFNIVGSAGVVTGVSSDVNLTLNDPGYCTLYFPKSPSSSDNVLISIASTCDLAVFNIEVNCPITLTGVASSVKLDGASIPLCAAIDQYPNVYYNIPNYGGVAGCPALHEFFVQDPYGSSKVPAGRYKIPAGPCGGAKLLTVDSNGVIIDVYNC